MTDIFNPTPIHAIVMDLVQKLSIRYIKPYCVIILSKEGQQIELISVGQHPGDIGSSIIALTNAITLPKTKDARLGKINHGTKSGGAALALYEDENSWKQIGSIIIIGSLTDLAALELARLGAKSFSLSFKES